MSLSLQFGHPLIPVYLCLSLSPYLCLIYLPPSLPPLQRTSVLQWTAAISIDLGPTHLSPYLPSLLGPPYREISDSSHAAGEALPSLAHEVVDLIKGVCGKEEFAKAYSQARRRAVDVRERRRKQAALEVGDREQCV